MVKLKTAILVGSLRKGSLTRKAANSLMALAPERLECSIIEIGDLPLYNEDLENDAPAPWRRFRSQIKTQDAILFLTPEYNRSIPGCLKNAIDVGSRPAGQNLFDGLPAGVVSVTPYKLGAFGANHALRQCFVFLNMPSMQQPEAYIGSAADLFDEKGGLKTEESRNFFSNFMASFARWAETAGKAGREHLDGFMRRRLDAANAYVRGDAAPLDAIVPRTGDASFFPPSGGSVRGAKEVCTRYDSDVKSFSPGGTTRFDVLQSGSDGDFAFWTGFQIADVRLGSEGKPAHMTLRITELFRFREGGWKLIHRHADSAADRKPS